MGRGVNRVHLIGNLGADPEVRWTANGNPVANLSLATDESYKDKNSGQTVPKTEWHRITIFGKVAEVAGQYLRKGSKAYIEGRLQTEKWQDQQGTDRYTTKIIVDINGSMQMLDSPAERPGGSQPPAQSNQENQAPLPETDDFQDDIPF